MHKCFGNIVPVVRGGDHTLVGEVRAVGKQGPKAESGSAPPDKGNGNVQRMDAGPCCFRSLSHDRTCRLAQRCRLFKVVNQHSRKLIRSILY